MSDTARSFSPMPEKLEKFLDGYQESKVLFAACDFGIFDILRNSSVPQSAADITNMLSSNLDATTWLLDTLVALELLEKTKQEDEWLYNNTEEASKFLTTSSPDSQLAIVSLHNKVGYPQQGNLESAVIEGRVQWMRTFGKSSEDVFRDALYSNEESVLRFTRTMHNMVFSASYALAKVINLTSFSNCCDLGGKFCAFVHSRPCILLRRSEGLFSEKVRIRRILQMFIKLLLWSTKRKSQMYSPSCGFRIPRHGFRISDTGFQSLSVELQSLVKFRILWAVVRFSYPRILDSPRKIFPDTGF